MLTNKPLPIKYLRLLLCAVFLTSVALSAGCRYDMQDQPKIDAYSESKFYGDGRGMREAPDGTVARGRLQDNKALYTGKKENADENVQVETTTDANGNTIVSSFPNAIVELPVPMSAELLERGEERYRVFCIVCHGPVGKGDGMVVRRGYPKPSTYHDDRLRNAPVGHFFDVISNGWGKMNGYSSQIPVADRWAIVAYIRALQASQNPNPKMNVPVGTESAAEPKEGASETQETQVNKDGGTE